MPWQDLDAELGEMFDDYSERAADVNDVMNERRSTLNREWGKYVNNYRDRVDRKLRALRPAKSAFWANIEAEAKLIHRWKKQ